jgi:hypothetical protein
MDLPSILARHVVGLWHLIRASNCDALYMRFNVKEEHCCAY